MTQTELEAAKNTKLASGQPITAAIHRSWGQDVVNELYNAQSRADVLAAIATALSSASGDQVFIIRAGAGVLVPFTLFSGMKFRAGFDASVDAYPSTGGSGNAGAILAGDVFPVTVAGDIDLGTGPETVPVKSLLVALVNTPGQTPANWRMI